jgi:hypothetical protein
MTHGTAAGLDELLCEHTKFSHPVSVFILCELFNLIPKYGIISDCFGCSYIVPTQKCDVRSRSLTLNDFLNNFRGVSICQVVSKLFESAIIDRLCLILQHPKTSLDLRNI